MLASGGAEVAVAHRACSATMSRRYTSSSSAVSTRCTLALDERLCALHHIAAAALVRQILTCPAASRHLQGMRREGALPTSQPRSNCNAVGAASAGAADCCQPHCGHPALQGVHVPPQPHNVIQYNPAVQSHQLA